MVDALMLIGSASAAYQSVQRGDELRLMQSITVDYIECSDGGRSVGRAGSLRQPVSPAVSRRRRQQWQSRRPLSALNWIARDAISDAM